MENKDRLVENKDRLKSERDLLFNEILKIVKNSNAEIGLVRAVLGEVDTAISMTIGRMQIGEVRDRLKER